MIVTVHTSRIAENLETMRLAYGKPLIFMCKANAYGHGMCQVSPCLSVNVYGVATEAEGATLRSCVSTPILVTAPRISDIPKIVENRLIPLAGEENYIRAIVASEKVRICHFKVDSGMHRSGIADPKKCYELAALLAEKGVIVEGICTHYKDAEEKNVLEQNARFDVCVHAIKNALFSRGQQLIPYTHVTYSGAPYSASYDRLRVGLAVYGYANGPTCGCRLKKAMEVTSEVLNVKQLKAGDSLGYNGIFVADRPLTACTVLGGYADGMDRRDLGNEVLINGVCAKIVAVCMDTFEAIADEVDLHVGDRVIILSDEIDAECIAMRRGTIPYEVLVGFDTLRAERKYAE